MRFACSDQNDSIEYMMAPYMAIVRSLRCTYSAGACWAGKVKGGQGAAKGDNCFHCNCKAMTRRV